MQIPDHIKKKEKKFAIKKLKNITGKDVTITAKQYKNRILYFKTIEDDSKYYKYVYDPKEVTQIYKRGDKKSRDHYYWILQEAFLSPIDDYIVKVDGEYKILKGVC